MAKKQRAAGGESGSEMSAADATLSNLSPAPNSRKKRKRLGIGEGSGRGKTSGKGQKGQKSRTGAPIPAGFEGGQMPIQRRLPKFGFTSRKKVRGDNVYTVISIERLSRFEGEGDITLEMMRERGLLGSRRSRMKILGGGSLDRKLTVEAHAVSKSARAAIEAAGGEVRIVS